MALARCGFKTAINKQDQTSNSMADKKWDGRNYFLQLGTCGITRLIVPSCTIQPMMMPQSTPDFHQSKQSKQFSTLPLIGNPQFIGGFPMFSSPAINSIYNSGFSGDFPASHPRCISCPSLDVSAKRAHLASSPTERRKTSGRDSNVNVYGSKKGWWFCQNMTTVA